MENQLVLAMIELKNSLSYGKQQSFVTHYTYIVHIHLLQACDFELKKNQTNKQTKNPQNIKYSILCINLLSIEKKHKIGIG
jgi:hypothetical protein